MSGAPSSAIVWPNLGARDFDPTLNVTNMPTATRTNPLSYLTDQLNELKQKGTHFRLRVLEDEQAPVCTFDGKGHDRKPAK